MEISFRLLVLVILVDVYIVTARWGVEIYFRALGVAVVMVVLNSSDSVGGRFL